jgi:predicted RNase H-like nuclease (RuvC/YqgF family)
VSLNLELEKAKVKDCEIKIVEKTKDLATISAKVENLTAELAKSSTVMDNSKISCINQIHLKQQNNEELLKKAIQLLTKIIAYAPELSDFRAKDFKNALEFKITSLQNELSDLSRKLKENHSDLLKLAQLLPKLKGESNALTVKLRKNREFLFNSLNEIEIAWTEPKLLHGEVLNYLSICSQHLQELEADYIAKRSD